MLGHFRFLLALLVVVFHLGQQPFCRHWGVYAVFGFYVISGYLMTLVLHQTYGFGLGGGARYLANRALRLFPPYLCVCALALLLLQRWGPRVSHFHEAIRFPATTSQWLGNLLIVPFVSDCPVRLIPPAWSLAVEIVFYFMLWLVIARSRWTVLAGLLAALGFTAYLIESGAGFAARYYTVSASALPFSVGAGLFFVKDLLRSRLPTSALAVVPGLFVAHVVLAPLCWADVFLWPFYINVALAALSVLALTDPRLRGGAWNQWLGSLSYPLFLCHWHAGFLAHRWVKGPTHSWAVLLAALPIAVGVSFLICRYVERPIARWRDRLKTRRSSSAVAQGPVPAARPADALGIAIREATWRWPALTSAGPALAAAPEAEQVERPA
jgi:peptidoglycan/LPS O-acetylase OafA/YrhL